MRFNRLSYRTALLSLVAVCLVATGGLRSAKAAEYEVRTFEGGSAWFVYDEPVDIALHVLKPNDPKCHEIGEIILLFENRDQLRDDSVIETAALAGMKHYAQLCRSLGANPSNQRKVAGIVAREGAPDPQGRVMGDARIFDAVVSSLTGTYQLRIRRNAVSATNGSDATDAIIAERDQKLAAQRAEGEAADQAGDEDRAAEITAMRATFDAALAESVADAQPPGLGGRLIGSDRAALTGVWSGSQTECASERLILFERDGAGTIEWWRMSKEDIGFLPWRSGWWELRDGTVIMSFDRRVEYDRLLTKIRDDAIDETAQFELKDVAGSELRLASTGGGFSPGMLFLNGAEKLFVRCVE